MDIVDKTLEEIAENDWKALWDNDYYSESLKAADLDISTFLESSGIVNAATNEHNGVVLNDRLIAEASLGVLAMPPLIHSEIIPHSLFPRLSSSIIRNDDHSYSLNSMSDYPPLSPLSDLESECFPAIPIEEAESKTVLPPTVDDENIKDKDLKDSTHYQKVSPQGDKPGNVNEENDALLSNAAVLERKSIAFSPANESSNEKGSQRSLLLHGNRPCESKSSSLLLCKEDDYRKQCDPDVSITLTSDPEIFSLPPTPPSSSSSDTESGELIPSRTAPLYEALVPQFCNPKKSGPRHFSSTRNPITTPLISTQPISAQESRRKKKEYMDTLERKVEVLKKENNEYRKKVENLENKNFHLLAELRHLQKMVARDEERCRMASFETLFT